MLKVTGLQGIRLPKPIQSRAHDEMKLSVEYHLTFLYRDLGRDGAKEKDLSQFFFGRTTRSNKLELTRNGDKWGTQDTECLYFHSSLNKGKEGSGLAERILLCWEVVLILEDRHKAAPRPGRIPE